MFNLSNIKSWLESQQWLLWATSGMMVALSLSALYSLFYASPEIRIFYHQVVYIVLGLTIALLISRHDYRVLKHNLAYLYIATLIIMGAVLVYGVKINGTTGWLDFKLFSLQPVEFAKLTTILILAAYLSRYHNLMYSWKVLAFSLLIPMPFAVLTLLQPDLGSTIALFGIWMGFILASSVTRPRKVAIILVGLLIATSGWFFFLKDYQKARLSTFLNPERDRQGIGYNTLQSITAIGSGGIFGKGLGYGSQSQLHFLPEAHSDFIFAVMSEEAGWLGVLFFLCISGLFYFAIISSAEKSRDNFGYFLSIGIFWFFLIHFILNIGMNLGMLPVIGLPLPFLSAGGTNLLISFIFIGILQSVARLGTKT
jgi:rod shape determining protein RodA